MSREALKSAAAAEVERWERQITDEVLRLLDRQEAVVLARLQGTKARKHTRHWDPPGERKIDPRQVLDPSRWLVEATKVVSPVLGRLFGSVYKRVAGQLDPSLPAAPGPDDDRVEAAVEARVERVADGMQSVVEEVQAYIDREEDAGSAMADIVTGVRDLYAARRPAWADRIATVSAVGAINQAALFAAADAGSSAKQWLSCRDTRVRETHVKADGQVRLLDERFRLGGKGTSAEKSLLMFPGDPGPNVPAGEVINCRCTLLFSPPRSRKSAELDLEAKAEDSHVPPAAVAAAARRGLALRRDHAGGTEVGVARARDLASGGGVSASTVRRMVSFFARHEVDKSADGWGSTSDPSPGYVAWLLWGGDAGKRWAEGLVARWEKGEHADEVKARVRTAAGAQQYGQPIGSVIRPDLAPAFSGRSAPSSSSARPAPAGPSSSPVVGKLSSGAPVIDGTRDPAVRAAIAAHTSPVPDPAETRVVALVDKRGRVGAYTVWQARDGAQPKGTILAVSVHPALRGQKIGDQLVAVASGVDPSVKLTSRPASSARPPTPAAAQSLATTPTATRPRRAVDANGQPVIASRAAAGDVAGTSGDFKADAARIERLQKAYLRDKVDTTSLHSRNGRWSREREKQQQAIIDHFLNAPGVRADRKLVVLGGLPGAGKTTTINSADGQSALGIDLDHYVTVNADEVKEQMIARGMVPDYPGLSADEAATLFHAESFEVAHSLMRQAAAAGKNFAYDTSLKTPGQAGFATAAASRSTPPPWTSTVVFVDVPLPVAKQRARDRYLAGGRYMPLKLIDSMAAYGGRRSSLPAENFDKVKKAADQWWAFDNAGTAPALTGQGGRRARRP